MATQQPLTDWTRGAPSSGGMAAIGDGARYSRGGDRDRDDAGVRAGTKTHCTNCGAHVSALFRRVFGGNDNQVEACHDCADRNEILRGAAAGQAAASVLGVRDDD